MEFKKYFWKWRKLWDIIKFRKRRELYVGNLSNEDLKEIAKTNEYVTLKENIFLNQDTEFKWPNINDEFISDKGRCLGLIKQIGILSDGRVVPCCLDQDANVLLGNIFETSLDSILNSDKVKTIADGFLKGKIIPELCKRCTFREKFSK